MTEINKILSSSREVLSLCREEARDSIEDPLASQWAKVDFNSLEPILTTLEISNELHFYCKQYHEKAKKLLRETSLLKNELENVEADILLKSSNSAQILSAAQNLDHECRQNLEPRLADLHGLRTNLKLATQTLRECINLPSLIELARSQTTKQKKNIFDTGYSHFLIIAGENEEKNNVKTLQYHFAAAAALERQLKDIELPNLPSIVHDIVTQQIKTGLEATAAIKNFVNFCTNSCKAELSDVKRFHDRLDALRDKEIQEITGQLQPIAERLRKIICEFYFKTNLIKKINRLEILRQNLLLFLKTLNDNFLEDLTDRTKEENSPLNPASLAQKMSESYFSGIKGLLRIIKLLCGSVGSKKMVSETELKEKLQAIMNTCSLYCSNNKDAVEKMRKFIHGHLEMYHKPFPYKELFSLCKKTLDLYGKTAERLIFSYQINPLQIKNSEDESPPEQNHSSVKQISLGRLIARIEAHTSALQKIQSDNEK